MDKPTLENKIARSAIGLNKIAVFVVALILTTAIIFQGNFLEGLLKFLGVGASELKTISISSVDDFYGRSGEWRADFEGNGYNTPTLQDTAVFSFFSNHPVDPGEEVGLVIPLWTGGANLFEIVKKTSTYTSPVVDLGISQEILHSIDVLDYQPSGSTIIYKYHVADSLSQLNTADYQVLEFRPNGKQSAYTSKQALLGLPLHRYLQFQISFSDFYPNDRTAVAEFNITYGPESELELSNQDLDMLPDLPVGIPGDLNNDGVVNSIDYAMFLELWTSFQNEDGFSPLD